MLDVLTIQDDICLLGVLDISDSAWRAWEAAIGSEARVTSFFPFQDQTCCWYITAVIRLLSTFALTLSRVCRTLASFLNQWPPVTTNPSLAVFSSSSCRNSIKQRGPLHPLSDQRHVSCRLRLGHPCIPRPLLLRRPLHPHSRHDRRCVPFHLRFGRRRAPLVPQPVPQLPPPALNMFGIFFFLAFNLSGVFFLLALSPVRRQTLPRPS